MGPTRLENREVLLAILTDLSIDHRCYKEALSLREAGFEPIILCDKPRRPLGSAWRGFTIRLLSPLSHLEGFGAAFLRFHLGLLWVLATTRSKLWISLDCPPLLTLAVMGKLRGATVVYDSHELFTETPLVRSRPLRRVFWTWWHNAGLALVHHVISVSPLCENWLAARFPGRRHLLLPNAPRLNRQAVLAQGPVPGHQGGPHSAPVRLVFQGGLRLGSGLTETFAALAALNAPVTLATMTSAGAETPGIAAATAENHRGGFTMDLYGDGPERAGLEMAAGRNGIQDSIAFHGQVPFEALAEPMAAAHIGVHLMQPLGDSFALTLANKLFDYIHAGLPVLLSDNPAHRAFLAECPVGVAVDSFSPKAIADGLQTLVRDWERYHRACLAARETWHWQAFAGRLPAFLLDECGSPAGGEETPR